MSSVFTELTFGCGILLFETFTKQVAYSPESDFAEILATPSLKAVILPDSDTFATDGLFLGTAPPALFLTS